MKTHRFDTVDSTNEVAKRLAWAACVDLPVMISAREQTAGRGTQGRRWASPRDAGVYLSIMGQWPHLMVPSPEAVTCAAAVACVVALKEATGLSIGIRPVNDLVISGSKLGGILCEILACGREPPILIIGIGINVKRGPRPLGQAGRSSTALVEHLSPEAAAGLHIDRLSDHVGAIVLYWIKRAARDAADIARHYDLHRAAGL